MAKPRINLRFRQDLLDAAKAWIAEHGGDLTAFMEAAVEQRLTEGSAAIYALVDPRTDDDRYVGRTTNVAERLSNHRVGKAERSNPQLAAWVQELRGEGLAPELRVLERVPLSEQREREAAWMAELARAGADLLNSNRPDLVSLRIGMDPEVLAGMNEAVADGRAKDLTNALELAAAAWLGRPSAGVAPAGDPPVSRSRSAGRAATRAAPANGSRAAKAAVRPIPKGKR